MRFCGFVTTLYHCVTVLSSLAKNKNSERRAILSLFYIKNHIKFCAYLQLKNRNSRYSHKLGDCIFYCLNN